MTKDRGRATSRHVRMLFSIGAVAGLSDGELLERFTSGRGETAEMAFAALLERHGPMVLRVCRRVLTDPHDAQDAFQATFLVLVRRAGSVRKRDSLASWLHGVAHRTASCARSAAARRRRHERKVAESATQIFLDDDREDLGPVLHEELERMPGRYRGVLVLCDLEGHTHDQAARLLALPVGTIKSRLTRGRKHLRERLIRRGWVQAAALGRPELPVPLPTTLMERTMQFAMESGAVPVTVATLTGGVMKSMGVTKLSVAAMTLLAVGIGISTVGVGVLAQQNNGPDKQRELGVAPDHRPRVETQTDNGHSVADRSSLAERDEQKGVKFPSNYARGVKFPRDHTIQVKLNEPVSFDIQKQPLVDAIIVLRNLTGVDIVLDPRSLKAVNITMSTPVTLSASKIRLKTALKLLLSPLGLTYKLDDDIIRITTPSGSPSATRSKAYYVGDLLLPMGKGGPDSRENGQIDMTSVIELIAASVSPGTWKGYDKSGEPRAAVGNDQGTGIGSITPFYLSLNLIIRHTDEVHEQVSERLRQVRRLPPLMAQQFSISGAKSEEEN